MLEGRPTRVRWTDGDTFKVLDGPFGGLLTRLDGYNTLESYGPVHRWGRWSPPELLALAQEATRFAAAGSWHCTSAGAADRYHRLLVRCPDAARALVRTGLAMVYAVDAEARPELLAAQRDAQREGRGMWAKGVPRGIVTNLHSIVENGGEGAYDRVADTRTGRAIARPHEHAYAMCSEVCQATEGDTSCMVYVPFERRYRNKPPCLQGSPARRKRQER